jgi:hypothetical protein
VCQPVRSRGALARTLSTQTSSGSLPQTSFEIEEVALVAQLQLCTVASRQYLPYARALAESITRTNPGAVLWVLLAEDLRHETDRDAEPFRALWNEDLCIDPAELHRMYLIHRGDFLAVAKPYLLRHVVEMTGEPALFIDSDIQVYAGLEDIGDRIADRGVVLFPHITGPFPLDGCLPNDTMILNAGTYQAGMIGIGPRGLEALTFLESRLRRECHVNAAEARVNEQRWLDLLPSLFDVHVERDKGINVGYWNLHERPLSRDGDRIQAGDRELRAFHFSGYEFDQPEQLSKHNPVNPRISLATQPIVRELCAAYQQAVLAWGYEAARAVPMGLDVLPNGRSIDERLRETYRAAVIAGDFGVAAYPPDAYVPTDAEAFLDWEARTCPTATAPSVTVPPAALAGPSADNTGELVRRLAASSAAALSNLDERLRSLEGRLSELQPTG